MPDIKQVYYVVFDIFKLCASKKHWTHNIQGKQEKSKKCKIKIKIKHFLFLNTGLYNARVNITKKLISPPPPLVLVYALKNTSQYVQYSFPCYGVNWNL